MTKKGKKSKAQQVIENPPPPPASDWRTSDAQEIARRRERAQAEAFAIARADRAHAVFASFKVASKTGLTYSVEVRDLAARCFACTCIDFRINGLGTCKHVEGVLAHLQSTAARAYKKALEEESPRIDIVPDREAGRLRVERNAGLLPQTVRRHLAPDGSLDIDPEDALAQLKEWDDPRVRISVETLAWMERQWRLRESVAKRREYELKVQKGEWPSQETKSALFAYQREGMLHLAFRERALLADEMGLGKTIQAIAACSLLHRLGNASRVLVVTPASLKTEWEEQIRAFTDLPLRVIFGSRHKRLEAYAQPPFFTIVNYEQVRADALDINASLRPDVVVLDEAQRIKNWSAKTAQAVKRLASRYAFVLTGTPLENRIDELRSIVDFLDPELLGPLFRFNREYYELDERGRPCGYRNLSQLRDRIAPLLLRRRKAEVETELPERTERRFFVGMTSPQQDAYGEHKKEVARLVAIAKRRALTPHEQDKLMREMSMMRMLCDTPYILDPDTRDCPKLAEIERILEECCADPEIKVLIFSEWERMLILVRELCEKMGLNHAWHTGSVPQRRRRAEITAFKTDPQCRIFLSTDSGGVGLNLQNASYVINCDLPWTPGRLEQRIARAWRKNQTRPVTVINLIAEHTIEHGMLGTLAAKQELAQGLLDGVGDLGKISYRRGGQALLKRLEQVLAEPVAVPSAPPPAPPPCDPIARFGAACVRRLAKELLTIEERFIAGAENTMLFVVVENATAQIEAQKVAAEHLTAAQIPVEVVSRETLAALDRLAAAGMYRLNLRATRRVYPEIIPAQNLWTAEQSARMSACRDLAQRRLRAARLLAANGLEEESRAPLLEALHSAVALKAVRAGLEEPPTLVECARQPWRRLLGEATGALAAWIENPGTGDGNAVLRWLDEALALHPGTPAELTAPAAHASMAS